MIATGWNSSVANVLRQRPLRRLIPVVNVVLVLAIAYSLAQLTWLSWPVKSPVELAPPDKSGTAMTAGTGARPQATEVAGLHLFGEVPAVVVAVEPVALPPPPPPPVVAAPLVPLNLVLKGVIAAEDVKNARAIIADSTGKEDSFGVNGKLPQDAILKQIFADHVIVTRANQDEVLKLPTDASPGGLPGADAGLAQGGVTPLPNDIPQVPEFGQGAQDALIQQTIDAAQIVAAEQGIDPAPGTGDVSATLGNYRDVLATNPQSLAGVAQAEPVQEGDKFLGYRVQPGSDPVLFNGLGLQPGDIVKSVNNIPFDSPSKATEILQALAGATSVQGCVIRNGQETCLGPFPVPKR